MSTSITSTIGESLRFSYDMRGPKAFITILSSLNAVFWKLLSSLLTSQGLQREGFTCSLAFTSRNAADHCPSPKFGVDQVQSELGFLSSGN